MSVVIINQQQVRKASNIHDDISYNCEQRMNNGHSNLDNSAKYHSSIHVAIIIEDATS